ncbi:hypothetical protein ACLB2K_056069 [Fragaria x ananassa]
MENLILKFRVEEGNRVNEKSDVSSMEAKANIVEGYKAQICRHKKVLNTSRNRGNNQANVAIDNEFIGMVFKVNMVSGTTDWWVDMGATRHICADRGMFSTYQEVDGENLFMGNASTVLHLL